MADHSAVYIKSNLVGSFDALDLDLLDSLFEFLLYTLHLLLWPSDLYLLSGSKRHSDFFAFTNDVVYRRVIGSLDCFE